MEEIREAALAYYEAGSEELKLLARRFFKSMDTNGDGTVSISEFSECLWQRGYIFIDSSFFKELDKDGDGSLDFEEVITFYYMLKTRTYCDECRAFLKVLYFTCVECFDHGPSYDLCTTCYCKRKFNHKHTVFMDNYVLLLTRRGGRSLLITDRDQTAEHTFRAIESLVNIGNTISSNQSFVDMDIGSSGETLADIGSTVGDIASIACSIM
ncbi:hypothetical protein HHK36_022448 [Tetracentron sinense]|uniref:EF-hand domain-containing protein n=1 Tax=Tetracentron sinense TaxID=13715 RepID=A0A834YUY2_TETSI|nr:hypothetical protein HHK36_022448 [Tetracentron sinense]